MPHPNFTSTTLQEKLLLFLNVEEKEFAAKEELEIVRIGLPSGGGWRAEIFSRRQKFRSNFFERTPPVKMVVI